MTSALLLLLLSAPPEGSTWTYTIDSAAQNVYAMVEGRRVLARPKFPFPRLTVAVTVLTVEGEEPRTLSAVVASIPSAWKKKPWALSAEYGDLTLNTGLTEDTALDEDIQGGFKRMLSPLAKAAAPPPADAPCTPIALDAVVKVAKTFLKVHLQDGDFGEAKATCIKGTRPQKYALTLPFTGYSGSNAITYPFTGTAHWELGAWIPSVSLKANFSTAPQGSRLKIKVKGTARLVIGLKRR